MYFLNSFLMTFSSRMLILITGLVSSIIIARAIGASGMGIYMTVITTSSILVLICGGGIHWSSTYLVGKNKNSLNDLFFNSVLFSIGISALLVVIYPLILRYMNISGYQNINPILILFILISIPFTLIWQYNRAIILGLQEISRYNILNIVNALSLVALNFILLMILKMKIEGALVCWILSIIIAMVISIYYLLQYINLPFSFTFNPALFTQSIKVGIKAMLSSTIGFLLLRSDIYLIGYFLGVKAIGLYSIAVIISELILKIPGVAGTLLFPMVSGDRTGRTDLITARISRNSVFIGVITGLFLYILGKPLIVIAFGTEFIPSYEALLWLLPGLVAFTASVIINNYIAGKGYPSIAYIAPFIALIANLTLNLILIPKMGINGAALATTISYTIMTVVIFNYFKKQTNIKYNELIMINKDDIQTYIKYINILHRLQIAKRGR